MKKYSTLYWILGTLLFIVLNSATWFYLIAQLIEVNIFDFDLSDFGNTVENKFKYIIKAIEDYNKKNESNPMPMEHIVTFDELLGGWRKFMVWFFIILGWASTIHISFKVAFKAIDNKKNKMALSKQKKEEYDLLKLKIKADMNMVNEKDLKQMEKSLYNE